MIKNEPEKISVSKLDAARRQLDCAIELWFADKDDVSIHTLVGAAHQIIHDINRKNEHKEILFHSYWIKDEYRREFISIIKKSINFFKHADKYMDDILVFNPLSSVLFIMFSIRGLEIVGKNKSDLECAFLFWLTLHYPRWFTAEYLRFVEELAPTDFTDGIRNMSKGAFLEQIMRACAERGRSRPALRIRKY